MDVGPAQRERQGREGWASPVLSRMNESGYSYQWCLVRHSSVQHTVHVWTQQHQLQF